MATIADNSDSPSTTPQSTTSETLSVGDIIVVFGASWDSTFPLTFTHSGTAVFSAGFTNLETTANANYTWSAVWVGQVTTAGTFVATMTPGATASFASAMFRYTGASLPTSANLHRVQSGTGTPNQTITIAATSAVCCFNSDWNGVEGAVTYESGTVLAFATEQNGNIGVYGGNYGPASGTSVSVGWTGPAGQAYTMYALEIPIAGTGPVTLVHLGSSTPSGFYVGSGTVSAIYMGSTKVWG